MINERESRREIRAPAGRGTETLGVLMIVVGGLFFAATWFDIDVWSWIDGYVSRFSWPFLVIVPGAVLLLAGLVGSRSDGALLSIGSVATTVGLILLFQNRTGLWASWSYAWTLIPAAVGVGQLLHGVLHGDGEAARAGTRLISGGLLFFALFAFVFEGLIGVSGFGFALGWNEFVVPMLLIGAGVFLVARDVIQGGRHTPGPTA